MICHGFKGGIGTASRMTPAGHAVGVLVQANHGRRTRLAVNGVPVGRLLEDVPLLETKEDSPDGSIIVVVATDAPLLPHQCDRLAQRSALGIARTGGAGENSSGDFALAFSTGNRNPERGPVDFVPNDEIDPLFYATIEATEEAIVNALLNGETMTGRSGTVQGLPHDRFQQLIASAER
jgi:D-aminopeptidase